MAFPRQRVTLPLTSWLDAVSYFLSGRLIEGSEIEEFERSFAAFVGTEEAIAIPSGRAGFQFILQSLELEPDSEIIIPAYTYPIVPFVVKSLGYRMKFVDIEISSLGLDVASLEKATSENTRAVIATHLFGVPCAIQKILEITEGKDIDVIEDCAHSCGAGVGNTKAGAFGRAAYFSFETSKCINTLGGGMITTSDSKIAKGIRALRDKGNKAPTSKILKKLVKSSIEALVTWPPFFSLFVYPALRMAAGLKGHKDIVGKAYVGADITMSGRTDLYTNFQAHLGLKQLKNIDAVNEERIDNANALMEALEYHVPCHKTALSEAKSNYLLFSILAAEMEETALRLLKVGVDTKRYYMRDCSALFDAGERFPNAAKAEREVLHLPSYPGLSKMDMEKIIKNVKTALREGR